MAPKEREAPEPLPATIITQPAAPVETPVSEVVRLMLTSTVPLSEPPPTNAVLVWGLPPWPSFWQKTDALVSYWTRTIVSWPLGSISPLTFTVVALVECASEVYASGSPAKKVP